MSFDACAALVERADPERFRAIMAAPVAARRILFPLYAFNVEVVRAPWVTQEEMIAEMRLQWWRDALEEIATGVIPRRHEVVDALADILDQDAARLLDGMVAARRWDVYADSFEGQGHFDEYINATTGHLMWTAARLLAQPDEGVLRGFAYGVGVANLLRAAPTLTERNRHPLPDPSSDGIRALAQAALARLTAATTMRDKVSKDAGAALLLGHAARPILHRAVKDPTAVLEGRLELSPFAQSRRLLHVSIRGWWA